MEYRCAIIIIVFLSLKSFSALTKFFSVVTSKALVGSSNNSISGLLYSALAIANFVFDLPKNLNLFHLFLFCIYLEEIVCNYEFELA